MLISAQISTLRLPIALKFELQTSCICISVLRAMTPCAIRNNKKTEEAELAARYVGTCDIKNVNIQEVHLRAHWDGSLVSVICSLY